MLLLCVCVVVDCAVTRHPFPGRLFQCSRNVGFRKEFVIKQPSSKIFIYIFAHDRFFWDFMMLIYIKLRFRWYQITFCCNLFQVDPYFVVFLPDYLFPSICIYLLRCVYIHLNDFSLQYVYVYFIHIFHFNDFNIYSLVEFQFNLEQIATKAYLVPLEAQFYAD